MLCLKPLLLQWSFWHIKWLGGWFWGRCWWCWCWYMVILVAVLVFIVFVMVVEVLELNVVAKIKIMHKKRNLGVYHWPLWPLLLLWWALLWSCCDSMFLFNTECGRTQLGAVNFNTKLTYNYLCVVVCFIVYYLLSLSFIHLPKHLHRVSLYDLLSILLITSLYSPDVWSHDSIAPFIIFT